MTNDFKVSSVASQSWSALTPQAVEVEEVKNDEKHPYGDPVSLMSIIKDTVQVDYPKIETTFNHPEVADRKIVAVSVIGALRKGKSFLMAYCLRFMYANVSETSLITEILLISSMTQFCL